jgi:glycogen debranching enzyme GlgX
LPVFEFNECENKNINPQTHTKLTNFWGYSTVNFFSPMNRYSSGKEWTAAIDEFKEMVKSLHENGIEVILDVVFNHTSECGETGPVHSFKGIDNKTYYILGEDGSYLNFSGTGNTFSCNHPIVRKLIIDSLEYWSEEMRVDGFRFDLASIFTRGSDGSVLEQPPLIDEILKSEKLKGKKPIAEAWDAAVPLPGGHLPRGEGIWAEWNGRYRDNVRRFLRRGQMVLPGHSCYSHLWIAGHIRTYKLPLQQHKLHHSPRRDSLTDLVSYQDKHNHANGEKNNDGASDNQSWNCGCEGLNGRY